MILLAVGGYFAVRNISKTYSCLFDALRQEIELIQQEKIHLLNCFLDKQNKPPLGVDVVQKYQEKQIEIERKKELPKTNTGTSPIKEAQDKARLKDALETGLIK